MEDRLKKCTVLPRIHRHNDTLVDFLSKKHYALWVENALAIQRSLGIQRGKNDRLASYRLENTSLNIESYFYTTKTGLEILNSFENA